VNQDSTHLRVRSVFVSVARRCLLAMLLVLMSAACFGTKLANAAPLSDQDTQRAEELGEAGVAAYQAGNLEHAKTQLEEGYRLSGWGTIGVWLAKTYDKLGLVSDAFRIYVEVASSPATVGEPEPFVRARAEAQQGVDAIAATAALVTFKSVSPKRALAVSVDGKSTALTAAFAVAVTPGEHTFDVSWHKGRLPRQTMTLVAGQSQIIELDARDARRQGGAIERTPVVQNINFSAANGVPPGWSLVDSSGKVLCELPCRWSGMNAESLVVKLGDQVLPVRLGKKQEQQSAMNVSVNPRRGSKAWALGIGIPSGVLFGLSLAALPSADYDTQTPLVISTSVFGAGFAACDRFQGQRKSFVALRLVGQWLGRLGDVLGCGNMSCGIANRQ
jgi:hypothetical protein